MKAIVTDPANAAIAAEAKPSPLMQRIRRGAGRFWCNYLFWHARRFPLYTHLTRPIYLWFMWHTARLTRRNLLLNARRLLGPESTAVQQKALAQRTMSAMYVSVLDIGGSLHQSRRQILDRIESIEGQDQYDAARKLGKGAIIVTAHMGSFETGAAALMERERRVHVVFQRDRFDLFERMRSDLRRRLGIIEAPVDEGWTLWIRLRNALAADEVVMMQGDRVMPGQKGQRVPFLNGTMMIPTGPVKLALAGEAPVIPVFSIRTSTNQIRMMIEDPIYVAGPADVDDALWRLKTVIERYVRTWPDQWIALHRAWCEDDDVQ